MNQYDQVAINFTVLFENIPDTSKLKGIAYFKNGNLYTVIKKNRTSVADIAAHSGETYSYEFAFCTIDDDIVKRTGPVYITVP